MLSSVHTTVRSSPGLSSRGDRSVALPFPLRSVCGEPVRASPDVKSCKAADVTNEVRATAFCYDAAPVFVFGRLINHTIAMASGRAALQYRKAMMERKAQMGQELTEEIHAKMKDAMAEFKRKLEEFALDHREEIRLDPEFRANFHAMCAHVGVDPLASNKASVNKYLSFTGWSFATFYYELGVAVVEVCMKTRPQNGGLIELNKLTRLVQLRRGSAVEKISADDVLQAVKKLQALDNSFTVIPDPKKVQSKKGTVFYVNSVPRELEMNVHDILDTAGDAGHITLEQLAARPTWTMRRAELALESMIKDGTCLIDDGDPRGVRLFWFPSALDV